MTASMNEQDQDAYSQSTDESIHLNKESEETPISSQIKSGCKLLVAIALFTNAVSTTRSTYSSSLPADILSQQRRSLAQTDPTQNSFDKSIVSPILDELRTREKLFEDTPPEEVKYWFEYAGPLQKYYYRYSKSRGKADSFEGRDDSGVTSARFIDIMGGSEDHNRFFLNSSTDQISHNRLTRNCLSMGAPIRPKIGGIGSIWYDWFGSEDTSQGDTMDRCRALFVLNTVGAGKGSTILWESQPPHKEAGPPKWQSEQATAAMHLERNLKEMDTMCQTGLMAVRLQVLVCEPIPGIWTDWMDSMLPNCGGKASTASSDTAATESASDTNAALDSHPSPVQVVVVASADTADTCHDLKSGFMEQRMQDLILAPPYLSSKGNQETITNFDPNHKTTHPDLISTDDHDLYIAMKWSSLVTLRSINSYLQSSADLVAAAASPQPASKSSSSFTTSQKPLSNLLIPSFVRVSYVSEENNKVAKWRMHGDFFHPAAWEVSKDSYDMTWIPNSLSSWNGASGACHQSNQKNDATVSNEVGADASSRRLSSSTPEECGQWWITMTEEQMPTTPEIYANEVTPSLIRGGSNFIWMLTESQRKTLVSQHVCQYQKSHYTGTSQQKDCGPAPQAVIPLGDLESHLINFLPNTALGKKHESKRRPGYSKGNQLEKDRERVRERKQLKGQEDIEKALFDYTIYPAALFHKDATVKAARLRDAHHSPKSRKKTEEEEDAVIGPQTIMSGYYDVTITKPREALPSWCQHLARRGMCSLYADYFRESEDHRCWEACGMLLDWKLIESN